MNKFSSLVFKKDEIPLLIKLFKLAYPLSISVLIRTLTFTVDASFLGKLGDDELAGASLAITFINIFTCILYAFVFVLNTLVGNAKGAKQYQLAGIWVQISLVFATIVFFLTIPGILLCETFLLNVLDADENIARLAGRFAMLSIPGIICNVYFLVIRTFLASFDELVPALVVGLFYFFINIGLNQLFIYNLDFQFDGSPIATTVTRLLTFLTYFAYSYKSENIQKCIPKTKIRENFTKERIKEYLKQSLPLALGEILGVSWDASTNLIVVKKLGIINLDSNSILSTLLGPMFSIAVGLGFGIQLSVSNSLGEGKPMIARKSYKIAMKLMTLICFIVGFIFLIPPVRLNLAKIFSNDNEVIDETQGLIPLFVCLFVLASLSFVNLYALDGAGMPLTSVLLEVFAHFITTLPIALISIFVYNGGLVALWSSLLTGEVLSFIIGSFIVFRLDWKELAIAARLRSEADVDSIEPDTDLIESNTLVDPLLTTTAITTPTDDDV